jgi:hypothetical protein
MNKNRFSTTDFSYTFTTLKSAVSYIENVTHTTLKISKEEYDL